MKLRTKEWKKFFLENTLILIIVCVATWLRVWQIDAQGILFSDAGRDLVVAYESVQQKSLPLLGIPSSVPRFKQGPISIWIEMVVIALFGVNTLAQSLVFALISIAAVIGVYEFVCIYASKKHALLAAALIAVSPLAVANGRVPYHTTPLPLALVLYLFALILLWHKKRYSYFFAAFAFAFVFQFELAMAPLFLLIPVIMWYQKHKLAKINLIQLFSGLIVGLLPQVIYDLTHTFAQIGVFFVWIGHKLYEFVSFKDGGSVHFENYFHSFSTYGGRIFSTDYWVISVAVLLVLLAGFYFSFIQFRNRTINPAWLITDSSILLLVIGYFIHGSPSEAYFPPFLILLPIHLSFTIFSLPRIAQRTALLLVTVLFFWNIYSITSHSFFVDNSQKFSYGPSTGEINRVTRFIANKTSESYSLKTFNNDEEKFPSLFDNYKWIALENGYPAPTASGKPFYVEKIESAPSNTPYIFRDFSYVRLYWYPSVARIE